MKAAGCLDSIKVPQTFVDCTHFVCDSASGRGHVVCAKTFPFALACLNERASGLLLAYLLGTEGPSMALGWRLKGMS